MTFIEQQIVDIIQDGFPIAERPYAVIAEKLGGSWTEQSVFDAVERLRASGIIRRIGGVYDSRKLGFVSRLCAGVVPAVSNGAKDDSALEKFAAVVAGIPAITHNYVRSHHYNIWFTVIAENEQFVQKIIDKLQKETDVYNVHILASKRMFKINTVMKSDECRKNLLNAQRFGGASSLGTAPSLEIAGKVLTDVDKSRIRLLSGDIPHTLTPFTDLCDQCGCNLDEFLNDAREDLATRRMRRFGAVLRHQEAGFAHNAMVCFNMGGAVQSADAIQSTDAVQSAGEILAANSHVSHCYERAPFEGFPYNLYAMFHAASAEELDHAIAVAAQSLAQPLTQSVGCDIPEYAVLHSVRELKKTSFTFFVAV